MPDDHKDAKKIDGYIYQLRIKLKKSLNFFFVLSIYINKVIMIKVILF